MEGSKKITAPRLDFDNTRIAFAHKSGEELRWSHRLFQLMSYPRLVNMGAELAMFAYRFRLPVFFMAKSTIYRQFCGGETIEECKAVIDRLGENNIRTILDYGVEAKESEEDFDRTAQYLSRTLGYAKEDEDIHIISTKLSGLFRFKLLEKVTAKKQLTDKEKAAYERGMVRVEQIIKAAHESNIGVHIDAEESWVQGAIDEIAWEMSRRYNNDKPTVINAVQLYRKDRLQFLQDSLQHARDNGYLCAVKLVRGAYMEKERERAEEMGYPSPIHETLEDTHRSFNAGLEFCVKNIGDLYFCNATHNEKSCQYLAQLMEQYKIPRNHPLTATAQLYGMGDHISYTMAQAGYNVEKYLPYGPVREVIPYLIRRTRENTSVEGQMSRELNLIKKELKRRSSQ